MDSLKNCYFNDLSHDLILNGSEGFYDKILPEDYEPQYFIGYPYPIQSPIQVICEDKLKLSIKDTNRDKQRKQAQREFNKMKSEICGQNFKKYAVLPNFFIDYMANNKGCDIDYGYNISHSFGVLEKFHQYNTLYLLRPDINNNLLVCKTDEPQNKFILQWLCRDQILNIKNMNFEYTNSFIVRGLNTINLIDIDEDLQIKIKLRLNCDIGYQDTASNNMNKTELAIIDSRNKLKLFNLDAQKISSTYTAKDLNMQTKPRLAKIDYLTQNMLMIMTDKHIKVVDNRCRDLPQDIAIRLENCDILLNFTLPKQEYLSDTVYMTSKHSYFIYDIRKTNVDDFINHNLKSFPCFINNFEQQATKLVTLFSQSPTERALFGTASLYSLPHHLINLEDTFDRCRSMRSIPVVPDIAQRMNYSITGVQLVANNADVSIYTTNIIGELFRQDIFRSNSDSQVPIQRMYDWLMEIYETYDPDLNVIHLAKARAAFNFEVELNEIDLYKEYEKCNIHQFLAEDLELNETDAETFLKIWDDNKIDNIKSSLDDEPSSSKVKKWIENMEFYINAE